MDINGMLFTQPGSDKLLRTINDKHFIRAISPDDNMYKGDPNSYFWIGLTGLDCIEAVMAVAGKPNLQSILDLPCGFGRVSRFIRHAYPNITLTVCDTDCAGVNFCAEAFDASPVYSSENIDAVDMPGRFDLIWVGSLFTHLELASWRQLLAYLSKHLEDDGVLIFTVAGAHVYNVALKGRYPGVTPTELPAITHDFVSTGFSHSKYQPLTVKEQNYGRTFVSRDWVSRQIRELTPLQDFAYISRGYGQRQDVFACRRLGSSPPSDFPTARPAAT